MKRRLIIAAGLCALLAVAVLAAVAMGGAGQPVTQGSTSAPDARQQCNFVLAGKDATADGSVMMAYNNDWSANNSVYLKVVPATSTTYRFVKIMCVGDIQEGGINEHQFAVNYGAFTDLDDSVLDADPYESQGYRGEMWDMLLQQCATCGEALDLLAQMAATRGFNSAAAGSFGFADPDETWVFELLGGHHWVAQRVPDDAVLAHPNMLVVQEIDLSDPANYRGSADLQAFAQSIGRYDPSEGPFDVAWAYGDRDELQTYYDTNRLWGAFNTVAPSLGLQPTMSYATRPVSVVPDEPVTRQDLMAINRYHYEDTALDQTADYTLMSPHKQTNRPICYSTTDYSAVWQVRDWLPEAVGGVVWVAPSRACASTFAPFYAGITSVPAVWTNRTAAAAFNNVALRLDKSGTVGGENYYKHYIPLVRSVYGTFETNVDAAQAATEATAAGLTGTAQQTYLTTYSSQRALEAYNLALSLPAQMP